MNEPRKAIDKATRRLTIPIAKFHLRSGLKWSEFEESVRRAFVAAAALQARENGQQSSVSQLAALTGFSRPEVRRLRRATTDSPSGVRDTVAHAQRVIDGWRADPQFCKAGRALDLPVRGPVPSMVTLVKRYVNNDQRAAPILRELEHAGAVCRLQDGSCRLIRTTCTNVPGDPDSLLRHAEEVAAHSSAGFENIQDAELQPHFSRSVYVEYLDPERARILMNRLEERAQVLVEGADRALNGEAQKATPRETQPVGILLAVQVLKVSRRGELLRRGQAPASKRKRKEKDEAEDQSARRGDRS